jgi:hypothetical protein
MMSSVEGVWFDWLMVGIPLSGWLLAADCWLVSNKHYLASS